MSAPSALLLARAGICQLLQATGANVYTHGGQFDRKQLEAWTKQAPAFVVSLLRANVSNSADYPLATAKWGVVAIAKNEPGELRDTGIVKLVEAGVGALWKRFPGNNPLGAVGRPVKAINCTNLFDQALDAANVAMWALEFEQSVDLVQAAALSADDLKGIHIDWQLAPDHKTGDPEAQDDIAFDT